MLCPAKSAFRFCSHHFPPTHGFTYFSLPLPFTVSVLLQPPCRPCHFYGRLQSSRRPPGTSSYPSDYYSSFVLSPGNFRAVASLHLCTGFPFPPFCCLFRRLVCPPWRFPACLSLSSHHSGLFFTVSTRGEHSRLRATHAPARGWTNRPENAPKVLPLAVEIGALGCAALQAALREGLLKRCFVLWARKARRYVAWQVEQAILSSETVAKARRCVPVVIASAFLTASSCIAAAACQRAPAAICNVRWRDGQP